MRRLKLYTTHTKLLMCDDVPATVPGDFFLLCAMEGYLGRLSLSALLM